MRGAYAQNPNIGQLSVNNLVAEAYTKTDYVDNGVMRFPPSCYICPGRFYCFEYLDSSWKSLPFPKWNNSIHS